MTNLENQPDIERIRSVARKMSKSFRGTIWENAQRFKLVGKAYEAMPREQGGHFDISSARHLAGPLRALRDPNVRKVFIIGAVQVLKSVVGDIWIPYLLEHELRNILVLFETDPKALLYCDTRFMDTIKQHPELSKLLGDVNRHDVTKTEIKVAGAKMLVGGLNDSNVSSLSWPIIWISEAWQHGSDGLLKKAIRRADRFPNDCKILIESQAGLADEDLHVEARSAHRVPLTWACPMCGARQTWECDKEYGQLRPDDFPIPEFRATYAGMKFVKEGTIDERARTAYWECYHCCQPIRDTRENRQKIMDSYEQDYQIAGPNGEKVSPSEVCFILPKESARDNLFESGVKSYLTANESQAAGNLQKKIDWYLQERAVFYSPRLTQTTAQVVINSSNIDGAIPNEAARMMMVDCQQHPDLSQAQGKSVIGHFWAVAWAIDRGAKNIFQLWRGYCKSWQEWIDVRKKLKIPNKNVCIDGGRWIDEVLDAAAANWEEGTNYNERGKAFKAVTVWTVMRGNGTRRSFQHDLGNGKKIYEVYSAPSYYQRTIQINGREMTINIPVLEWSNLSVKDQLFAIRQGGPGKAVLHVLARERLDLQTQEKEVGTCTYSRQVSNEYRTRKNNRDIWLESDPNVHYNDCECMGIVKAAQGGLLGHIEAPAEEVTAV